jgi:thiol-disulfide isomerase/thioredoxin
MSGMDELIDAYIKTDPEKAVRLTDSIGGKQRRQAALALIQIGKLEQTKNYKEAFTMLDTLKLPRFNELEDFLAFKKASLLAKGGDVKAAYNNLAENFAKLPTDEFYTAIEQYGKELGKDKEQIASDIKSLRYAKAETAYPFNLGLYTSKDSLSLKSLKGKVVLLTFWFPGCGPCRAEFPHFQAVINKFKPEEVAYIGINVYPDQEPYLLPLMKNAGYSFIPLRGNGEFARKAYGVQGEPTNFLIDKNGKIVYKNFRIDQKNHRTLELMIASLQ